MSFDQSVTRAWDVIAQHELSVFTTFDLQRSAASVGLDSLASEVIVFGDPNAIAEVVQESPLAALELPLRLLIHEDDNGRTQLSYYDPIAIAEEFELEPIHRGAFYALKHVVDGIVGPDTIVLIDEARQIRGTRLE